MLILNICLWEGDINSELRRVISSNELGNLANDFETMTERAWAVYDFETYKREEDTWANRTRRWSEFCDVAGPPLERRLSRSLYDILMTYLRLKEFSKSYTYDSIQFAVRFENVKDDDGLECLLIPLLEEP